MDCRPKTKPPPGCRGGSRSPRNCDKNPVDFYQVINKVKCKMDDTFRGLEGGLRGVEKCMNDEIARILNQVIEFEDCMKPKLLMPYKKCKELENLVCPVIASMPKRRPNTARARSTCRRPEPAKERCKSKPDESRCKSPETLGRERFRDLICSPSLDRVNPWEGSEERYEPVRAAARESCCTSSSRTASTDDEVGRTLKELQGISASVNRSLRRINRAFNGGDDNSRLRRCAERKPDVLHRVNESLSHIGAGALLMQRLLCERRGNC